jgi:ATP-dependent helicase/nuclease subunit B
MRHDSLFSIDPDQPFLETLANGVLDRTLLGGWERTGPFWLADVTIILPTRRARLALARILAERLGGSSLLPDIRTFGGEVADEEPFLPPYDAPEPLRPTSGLERTLSLARLVAAWAVTERGRQVLANPPNAAEVFGLAQSLGTVIDDLAIEGGQLSALDNEIGKLDLAENWQQTRQLLEIAVETWPLSLAERGRADPAVLRNDRLRRQAAAAPLVYGERPVIAAGSTGSIPATADLLHAILALPRGAVVLPGLDTTLAAERFAKLLDPGTQPHGHPQYAMAGLLRRLGTVPTEVVALSPADAPRTRLVRLALAPAAETSHWAEARAAIANELDLALAGVEILAARTVDEEARAIAIAARDALERGKTVGIVSPDQTLSRRIVEDLRRFDIDVDDAAGTPLFQSGAGRLVRMALAAATSRFAPVDLMALLDNRATVLGLGRAVVAPTARLLDVRVLRGERPGQGIAGLRALVARRADPNKPGALSEAEARAIDDLLLTLDAALRPLSDLLERSAIDAATLAAAIGAGFEAVISGGDAAALPDGTEALRRWVSDLATLVDPGPPFGPIGLDSVLAALMAGMKVTSPVPRRDDIAIWGRLEARLMNPDLLVLAGLNEEIWPEPADPGPWLSRGMRLAAGLEPPERQHGQAAHDFEMGLGNRNVLLAFAERRGTSPALPSRFLQRLEALVGEAWSRELRACGARWRSLARRLDLNDGPPVPARRPEPRPPLALRPDTLSVTDIETLYRSPYDIHAKYVLRLRRMARLGETPEGRERGEIVHDIFARFVIEGHDVFAADAQATLMDIAREEFSGLDAIGERRDLWLNRFARAADAFLTFERGRDGRVLKRHAEIKAGHRYPSGFTLTGRADRVDIMVGGGFEIIDYKTGSIPEAKAMRAYEAPQLLLEAHLVQQGGFEGIAASTPEALTYIKIGLGPEAFVPHEFALEKGVGLAEATDTAGRFLQSLVAAWLLRDDRAMTARIRPLAKQRFPGDYDHLARTDEWTIDAGEDE